MHHEAVEGGTHSYMRCFVCGKKLSHGVITGEGNYHLTQGA